MTTFVYSIQALVIKNRKNLDKIRILLFFLCIVIDKLSYGEYNAKYIFYTDFT